MAGRVLLVSLNPESRSRMEQWLRRSGFVTEAAGSFADARERLTAVSPDALVTDARLGDFNGLHLAIVGRSRRPALVAIVIGPPDAVLAQEADRHGATYLHEPVSEEELVAHVTMLLHEVGRQRRWPRKHVADRVDVEFNESTARIVDLSYGGLRLEMTDEAAHTPELGSDFRVSLPAFGVSVDAALVWVGRAPSGQLLCGAALADVDPAIVSRWRQVVDQVGFSIQ
jgi:DNA-binding response OmpR family regulator